MFSLSERFGDVDIIIVPFLPLMVPSCLSTSAVRNRDDDDFIRKRRPRKNGPSSFPLGERARDVWSDTHFAAAANAVFVGIVSPARRAAWEGWRRGARIRPRRPARGRTDGRTVGRGPRVLAVARASAPLAGVGGRRRRRARVLEDRGRRRRRVCE